MILSNNNATNTTNERRFVLFLGPPKTGSTSLQQFLAAFANKKSKHAIPAFQNWNYPLFLGRETGLRYLDEPTKLPTIRKTFRNQVDTNIVAGSEYLSSHRRFLGGHLFETLQNWTGGVQPEIVLMLRSPRVDHLISCWKQGSQVKGKESTGTSFQEWLCNPAFENKMQRTVMRTTNPLQIAYETVVGHNLSTTIVDMFGVSNAGLDASHVFSCEVLHVPCAFHAPWVLGLGNTTIHANSRRASSQLSIKQTQAMELAFQQRDCAYYDDLADHPSFRMLYRHNQGVWPQQCQDSTVTAMPVYRQDRTALLQELRKICRCPAVVVNSTVSPENATTRENEIRGMFPDVMQQELEEKNKEYNVLVNNDSATQEPGTSSLLYEPPMGMVFGPSHVIMIAWIALATLFLMGWVSRRLHRAGGRISTPTTLGPQT